MALINSESFGKESIGKDCKGQIKYNEVYL